MEFFLSAPFIVGLVVGFLVYHLYQKRQAAQG